MDDAARLKELEDRRSNILHGIGNIERDITGAENALLRGEPPERLVSFLRERQADLRDHAQDLGAVEARLEDLKARSQEREGERTERGDARRLEDRNPARAGEDAWFRKPAGQTRETTDTKPREWFQKERDGQEPEKADDRYDRKRER